VFSRLTAGGCGSASRGRLDRDRSLTCHGSDAGGVGRREWKWRLFLTNHPGLEDQFSELSLPSVRERIQRWLDAQHYPGAGDPDEYGVYIERCGVLSR